MRKFIAGPRVGRLAFTTCVVVFALAASARAEDSSLTDKQKEDLANACVRAGDVCKNSCGLSHPSHETNFNEGLLFDFCVKACDNNTFRCINSISARNRSGSSGGLVLDPGSGNPNPRPFKPKRFFNLPSGGGTLSK